MDNNNGYNLSEILLGVSSREEKRTLLLMLMLMLMFLLDVLNWGNDSLFFSSLLLFSSHCLFWSFWMASSASCAMVPRMRG